MNRITPKRGAALPIRLLWQFQSGHFQGSMGPLPVDRGRWRHLRSHYHVEGEPLPPTRAPDGVIRGVGTYAEEFAYNELCEIFLHQMTILEVRGRSPPSQQAAFPSAESATRSSRRHRVGRVGSPKASRSRRVRDRQDSRVGPEGTGRILVRPKSAPSRGLGRRIRRKRAPGESELVALVDDELDLRVLLKVTSRSTDTMHSKAFSTISMSQMSSTSSGKSALSRDLSAAVAATHDVLQEGGWQQDDIAFGVSALTNPNPISPLLYESPKTALEGLRQLRCTLKGWSERSQIHGERGDLVIQALRTIAALAEHMPLDAMR